MTQPPSLQKAVSQSLPAGTVLFLENEIGEHMYVIQSGKVQISRNLGGRETVLAVLPPGEFFGEMSLINNRPRSATATVIEDAQLLVIDHTTFASMIRGSTEIAVRMIKKLADRLAEANHQIELLLYQEPTHRIVRFLMGEASLQGTANALGTVIRAVPRDIAQRVGLDANEVYRVMDELVHARLLARTQTQDTFVIFGVGKLQDYLDYLDLRDNVQQG